MSDGRTHRQLLNIYAKCSRERERKKKRHTYAAFEFSTKCDGTNWRDFVLMKMRAKQQDTVFSLKMAAIIHHRDRPLGKVAGMSCR